MRRKLFRAIFYITAAVLVYTLSFLGILYYAARPRAPLEMLLYTLGVLVSALLLGAVLASRFCKKLVKPFSRIDLDHPLENEIYDELKPVMQKMNQQNNQIRAHLQELNQKNLELGQITENMQDGLVLLDSDATILSINSTAKALFSAEGTWVGKSIFAIDRSQELRAAVNDALDQGHGTLRIQRNGRDYRLDLSRIQSGSTVIGAVMLAFDMTEVLNAQRNRREFSANVSHELKTPLQTIMGSAELLENGMVKPEDTPRFIGHIHQEAARLLNLIEDIIRLSQLDENVPLPTESVELLSLAKEAAAVLQSAAAAKQVRIQVEGTPCPITGVRRLLYEILYNLCDNAIKYNVSGGTLTVRITAGEQPSITVTDTGIGIPAEHQSRVFERFYRVDKSHSKASGGTGLGLSIVKHAAEYHNARLALQSAPGKGTTVTVTFG